jgi:2-polyprenyl-3-methyl-5-hydroxy-6-metoxy-1,4-benzoquinol methylase
MQSVSEYNQTRTFEYEMAESRLRKCARLIEKLPPGVILDIGCSTGTWAAYWMSKGWVACGVDVDRKHVDVARTKGIDAHYCDLNSDPLPFSDEHFDLVFAGEVIEHLVDTDGFLAEVARCTKPGGHVLITTPNLASFENRVRLLFGVYPNWLNYNLKGSGHVRGYTSRVLKKQLNAHGLRVIRHLGNWVPFIPQYFTDDVKIPILAITGDWFPSLSMDIMVMARKE